MSIRDWSATAANNAANPPSGAPEGMMPSSLDDTLRQIMADLRAQWENAQFFDFGDTPTYVSATQFTVPGNLTARYAANQRITASGTGTMGTIYGTISSSAYGTLTTVTVTWDAGGLDSTLSTVAVGILSNNGMPRALSGMSIDNTPIGQTMPAAIKATTLTSTGATSLGATSASSIDNTPIGQTTPAAVKATTLTSTGTTSLGATSAASLDNTPIGQTTPAAVKATTLTSTSTTSLGATSAASLDNTPIGQTTPAAIGGTTLRATGLTAPSAGQGMEMYYTGGKGYVTAFDRTANAYLPAVIQGSTVTLVPNSGAATVQGNLSANNIDSTPIGQTTPAALTGTTIHASGGHINLDNGYYLSGKNNAGNLAAILGIDSSNITRLYANGILALSFDASANGTVAGTTTFDNLINANAPSSTNAGAAGTTNTLKSPLQTVSLFLGDGSSVTGLTGDQFSSAVRFNGSNKAWGDLSYYPMAATGNYGLFRLSTTGSALGTTPNASLGVGKLLANAADDGVSGNAAVIGGNMTVTGGQFNSNNTFGFLTTSGAAQQIKAGGVLISDSYTDISNVPTTGMWSKGEIRSAAAMRATGIYLNGGSTPLSDYEEGTFTPTLAGMTTAGAYTYYNQVGIFTRIGRVVYFEIRLEVSGTTTAASGNLLISGLPYTSNAVSNYLAAVAVAVWKGFTLASGQLCVGGDIPNSSTSIHLLQSGSSNGVAALTSSSLAGNPTVYCAGHYFI